jgi:integrase/recombinase XerD
MSTPEHPGLRRPKPAKPPRTRTVTGPAWAVRIPGPSDPLPQQMQQYLEYLSVQHNRPATTVKAYRQDLAKFAAFMRKPRNGSLCKAITRDVLRRYQIELAEVLPHARTRARALVALRRFLSYAYDEKWTAEEYSRAIVVPRYVVGDPHPVPTDMVPQLLAALPTGSLHELRDRALVHFLIASGCRVSEACSVDRADVRQDGFRVLGKGSKYRTVLLTSAAWTALTEYLEARGEDRSPALFINLDRRNAPKGTILRGNRLSPQGARYVITTLRHQPELAMVMADLHSPHGARHTAATTLLEATGGNTRLVQEVLGHASLKTLQVYTEITDRSKHAAYRQLDAYLAPGAA